jgi:hypothetical protein
MPNTITLAGITGYELKWYFVKISNTANPTTDGNNIHNINSKIYVLNFNILKILPRKGNAYSELSKKNGLDVCQIQNSRLGKNHIANIKHRNKGFNHKVGLKKTLCNFAVQKKLTTKFHKVRHKKTLCNFV